VASARPSDRHSDSVGRTESAGQAPGGTGGPGLGDQLWDDEAERSVLGAMLVAPARVPEVLQLVRPEDFNRPSHRPIFEAIGDVHGRGIPTDVLTVRKELEASARMSEVQGGAGYLASLTETVPIPASAPHYAGIVARLGARRRLLSSLHQATETLTHGGDVPDVLPHLQAAMSAEELPSVPPNQDLPTSKIRRGGAFALDAGSQLEAIWGRDDEVAWSAGEPLLIVGPTGVGHTTIAQRLILARSGLRDPSLLGLPVKVDERPILYVAADRPRQARRSLRRMVGEDDRRLLDERLIVWEGPPEFDLAREPERLAKWAKSLEAGTVVLEALKDVTNKLREDETGLGITRAFNYVLAEGIEIAASHHQRKATGENRKPNTLDDVYGSAWITAGAGSVILLWGKAGDPVVELSQLKLASGEVGPFRVAMDFDTGGLQVDEGTDPLAVLRAAKQGLTAREASGLLYGSDKPAEIEKARRQLQRLESRGLAHREEGDTIGSQGAVRSAGARWFAVTTGMGGQAKLGD
jgi:replicative DNA helicase